MLLLQVPSLATRIRSNRFFPAERALQPEGLFTHAEWLDQGFPHCPKFPTAASRRSLDRVSVPVWQIILSDLLLIVALVSLYLTN